MRRDGCNLIFIQQYHEMKNFELNAALAHYSATIITLRREFSEEAMGGCDKGLNLLPGCAGSG